MNTSVYSPTSNTVHELLLIEFWSLSLLAARFVCRMLSNVFENCIQWGKNAIWSSCDLWMSVLGNRIACHSLTRKFLSHILCVRMIYLLLVVAEKKRSQCFIPNWYKIIHQYCDERPIFRRGLKIRDEGWSNKKIQFFDVIWKIHESET